MTAPVADAATPQKVERLNKELGLIDVYAISTGAMFSSGFFLLPGLAAATTGPSVALAYLVAAVFVVPAMLSIAELATAMPRAGGAYYFLERSLGPMVGTVGGVGTWFALVFKSAFALVGMGAYLALYIEVPIKPLAVVLALAFMVVNIVGAKETGGVQRALVAALIAIMIFFIVQGLAEIFSAGVVRVTDEQFRPFFTHGFHGFIGTVGFVFVSYAGLTHVASIAEEVHDPGRNIPLGMILSLASAALIYGVGVYIIVGVLPAAELWEDLTPVATAAAAFFDWLPAGVGVLLIVIAAIAAFASTGNAGIMSASRYPMAMARDRLIWRPFSRLGRFNTPTLAVVITAGIMILAILALDVESIAKLASAFQLMIFSLLCLAVVIMRESGIEGYDPGFRSPLYPWVQIFGMLSPFWLIAEMGPVPVAFSLGLTALAIGWYFFYVRGTVPRTGAIFHAFARLGEQRHSGLDLELRGIAMEKGLRDEDPFDRIVARAPVLDFGEAIEFEDIVEEAAVLLAERTGLDAERIRDGLIEETKVGAIPVASGAALPHLRSDDLDHPEIVLVRCREGVRLSDITAGGSSEAIHAIFFLVSARSEPGQHLRLLGHLATHVDDETFLKRWLLARDEQELKETLLREEHSLALYVRSDGQTADWVGSRLKDHPLPPGALVALIRRRGRTIIPSGSTVLEEGDRLTIIGDAAMIRRLALQFSVSA